MSSKPSERIMEIFNRKIESEKDASPALIAGIGVRSIIQYLDEQWEKNQPKYCFRCRDNGCPSCEGINHNIKGGI